MSTTSTHRIFPLLVMLLVGCRGAGGVGGGGSAGGGGGNGGTAGAGGVGGLSGCLCRPAPPCPAGWWEYAGSSCDHWGSCWEYGDHLCYQSCSTDADCTDPGFPSCSPIIQRFESDVYYYTNACNSVRAVEKCPSPGGYGGASAGACPAGAGGAGGGGPDAPPACIPRSSSPTRATWKMPNPATTGLPNPSSYTGLGDGTVRDDVTGLVWQREVSGSGYSWYAASDYCATLRLTDAVWRLPTRIELVSLVDFTKEWPGPAIDTDAFPDTPGEEFWSSTPVASSCTGAWSVTFRDGGTEVANGATDLFRVRCVRATTVAAPADGYRIASGEVLDPETGLAWQQVAAPSKLSWPDAEANCASLSLGGQRWRVPSMKELQTLVDDAKSGATIDTTAFSDVVDNPWQFFWSSSPLAGSTMAWFVYFGAGYTSVYDKSMGYRVRCVR